MTNTTERIKHDWTAPIMSAVIATGLHFCFLYYFPITKYSYIFLISAFVTLLVTLFFAEKIPFTTSVGVAIAFVLFINLAFSFFNININEETNRVLSNKISNFEDYSVVIRFSDSQLKAGIERHNKNINDQQELKKKAKEKEKIEAEKIRNL
jgi:hypothetical protein